MEAQNGTNGHGRRKKTLNFDGYAPLLKGSMAERGAHALHWAAQRFPKQYVPYTLLAKVMLNLPHMPRAANPDVVTTAGRVTSIREKLIKNFGCSAVVMPKVGVRATVDSEDVLKTDMVSKSKRLASARRGYVASAKLVDVAEVPKTEDNKPWIGWYQQGVKQVLGQISSDAFGQKLLPPSSKK